MADINDHIKAIDALEVGKSYTVPYDANGTIGQAAAYVRSTARKTKRISMRIDAAHDALVIERIA